MVSTWSCSCCSSHQWCRLTQRCHSKSYPNNTINTVHCLCLLLHYNSLPQFTPKIFYKYSVFYMRYAANKATPVINNTGTFWEYFFTCFGALVGDRRSSGLLKKLLDCWSIIVFNTTRILFPEISPHVDLQLYKILNTAKWEPFLDQELISYSYSSCSWSSSCCWWYLFISKSNRDEIWRNCSSTHIDWWSNIFHKRHNFKSWSWHHSTQESGVLPPSEWKKHLPHGDAAAPVSSWSIVHSYLLEQCVHP